MKWTMIGLIASLALIVGSVGMSRFQAEAQPVVPVEPRSVDLSLGTVETESYTNFDFQVVNRGDHPLKVRGNSGACNLRGCVATVEAPGMIAEHQSARIRMQYKSNQSGPFEQESTLFLEYVNNQSERRMGYSLPITVRGVAITGKSTDD